MFERVSLKRLILLFSAAIVASVSLILTTSQPAFAEPAADTQTEEAKDAQWSGSSIIYQGNTYDSLGLAGTNGSLGFDKGTPVYRYTTSDNKAYIISFTPGEDPTKATTAKYAVYTYVAPDSYSNPQDKKDITLATQAESEEAANASSCVYEGIGWILCPITNHLAKAMDWVFHLLSGFLTVRPLEGGQSNPLYRGWSVMRDVANVAFVIGFLVIIYSQITGMGFSTYNIKRTLPRLIAAAILVNTSFWICAIAVDLSNIAGFSLEAMFLGLRNMLTDGSSNNWDLINVESITTAVLSGGVVGAAAVTALVTPGALYMLLPVLVGAIISLLVALIIMAARQALIVLLVIIAPLAFVAYLLPNTEKYFDKWKNVFVTMLVLFPVFSVLFGGAQVAGTIILLNADGIAMVFLAIATQASALAILPFTLKFGGGFLNRIGAITNNANKGLIDRTRNFANEQAASKKAKMMAQENPRRFSRTRAIQSLDQRRRRREGQQRVNEAIADNRWENSSDFHSIDTARRETERAKQMIHSNHEADWNRRTLDNHSALRREMQMRAAADRAELAKADTDATYAEFKAFDQDKFTREVTPGGRRVFTANAPESYRLSPELLDENSALRRDAVSPMRATADELALTNMRRDNATAQSRENLRDTLLSQEDQREYAGGVKGHMGAESAFATAIRADRDEYENNTKSKAELMKHFNLDSTQYHHLAVGKKEPITLQDSNHNSYSFTADDMFTHEAAIGHQMKAGAYKEIEEIFAKSWKHVTADGKIEYGATGEFATSISAYIKENKLDGKAGFFGSQTIGDIAQGRIFGDYGLDAAAIRYIQAGKVGNEALSKMAPGALERMFKLETISDQSIIEHMESLGNTYATDADRAKVISGFRQNMSELRDSATTILGSQILSRNAERGSIEKFKEFARGPMARTSEPIPPSQLIADRRRETSIPPMPSVPPSVPPIPPNPPTIPPAPPTPSA